MSTAHAVAINAQRARAHYDRVSKWYRLLRGEHIHQGYGEGVGPIMDAQENLIARLRCGLGGSAFWLAEHFGCSVSTQIEEIPGGNTRRRPRHS